MVTLLPTLAGFSLYWSGRLIESDSFTRFLMPFVIELTALVLMNKLLPRANVNWSAALAGATVTALVLEAMKVLFVRFAERMLLRSYSSVYGPLGLVPLALLWLYASWVLVLLGAEIATRSRTCGCSRPKIAASATTNRSTASWPRSCWRPSPPPTRPAARASAGPAGDGVRLDPAQRRSNRDAAEGTRPHRGGPRRYQRLHPWAGGLDHPARRGLSAFRSTDIELAEGSTSPALQEVVQDLDESRRRRIAGVTIAKLMPAPDGKPREEAVPLTIVPPGGKD